MTFERARSPEGREFRKKQIREAALSLFLSQPYDRITFSSIAGRLDFSRANLYKYYQTREEIFLDVLIERVDQFVSHLADLLEDEPPPRGDSFCRLFAGHFMEHHRLIELLTLLYPMLEENVSLEVLADFKGRLFSLFSSLKGHLEKSLDSLNEEGRDRFVMMSLSYAIGLYPTTRERPRQRQAMEKAGVTYEIPDFLSHFTLYLEILLEGLNKRFPR